MAVFTIFLYSTFLFLALISKGQVVSGLQCYKCNVLPDPKPENSRLCVNFNYSQAYVVECPYSTMCTKRKFEYTLQGGVHTTGVERNCAVQKKKYSKLNMSYSEWQDITEIVEMYEEGCHPAYDDGEDIITTVNCYCRGHLCNDANHNMYSHHRLTIGVILPLFFFDILEKYINYSLW